MPSERAPSRASRVGRACPSCRARSCRSRSPVQGVDASAPPRPVPAVRDAAPVEVGCDLLKRVSLRAEVNDQGERSLLTLVLDQLPVLDVEAKRSLAPGELTAGSLHGERAPRTLRTEAALELCEPGREGQEHPAHGGGEVEGRAAEVDEVEHDATTVPVGRDGQGIARVAKPAVELK